MTTLPTCILYTQDEKLEHKIQVNLRLIAKVRSIHSSDKLIRVYRQSDASILLVDLRGDHLRTLLPNIRKIWPDLIIIALGVPKSDPMIEAESMDLYATESLDADRQKIQALVSRAQIHLQLLQENQILKEQTSILPSAPETQMHRSDRDLPTLPLQHFSRAFRHFEDIDLLLKHMAEAVATSARVTRVGIFCLAQEEKAYELRAGYRCLDTADTDTYDEDDFLVQWLQDHGHVIARNTLEFVKDHKERRFLKEALDVFGVEVIMPIQARGELLGWLLIGHRITGIPFETPDLEDLMVMADHVSAILDNALLYEQVSRQKTLANQLLQSMPTGIVAISEDATIRMVNASTEQILNVVAENITDKAIEVLGSRLAGLARQTIEGDEIREPKEWFNKSINRHLTVYTRRLVSHGKCIGALVLVQDATVEKMLKEKQDRLDRATFWTELAASISHEVRNPLVAIKTFAQLLPERYDDPEFRAQFSQLVDHEVDRLNGIVDQIHDYAHPPKFTMEAVDVGNALQKGLNIALMKFPDIHIKFDISVEDNLPKVWGDEAALTECFTHMCSNAIEAVIDCEKPHIRVSVKNYPHTGSEPCVQVQIADNGGGIVQSVREKLFSPFSTTKDRGMGLGLPITKRTIEDHKGRLNIETEGQGTLVTVAMPVAKQEKKKNAR